MLGDTFRALPIGSVGHTHTSYRIPASTERPPAAAMPKVSTPEVTGSESAAPDVEDASTRVPLAYNRLVHLRRDD